MQTQTFAINNVAARKNFVETMLASGTPLEPVRLEGTQWTFGVVQFADGWSVKGSAVCVDPADYDVEKAKEIIAENAMAEASTHYWRTVGYLAMIGHDEITVPWNPIA
ncbi:hypothetical protein VPHD518_0026 [Vibrio phage D518]